MIAPSLPPHILHAVSMWQRNIPSSVSADAIRDAPEQEYLVQGLLPSQGIACIFGESGSGKSFIAMDLTFGLAIGRGSWFGFPTKTAPVHYVALEGQSGLRRRILAWEKYNEVRLTDRVQFHLCDFDVRSGDSIDDLVHDIRLHSHSQPVVVIDTLNQSSPGMDENSSSDMGEAIRGVKRIARETESLVVIVHHAGKDQSKGLRGHSSLFAAMDVVIKIKGKKTGRTWSIDKSKDGEAGQEYDFDLIQLQVGFDHDGNPLSSCAVVPTLHPPSSKLGPVAGGNRTAAMAVLRSVLATQSSVDLDQAATHVAGALICEQRRRKTVAKSTIQGLIKSGHLSQIGSNIELPP